MVGEWLKLLLQTSTLNFNLEKVQGLGLFADESRQTASIKNLIIGLYYIYLSVIQASIQNISITWNSNTFVNLTKIYLLLQKHVY